MQSRLLFFLLFCFFIFTIQAQSSLNSKIGINYSPFTGSKILGKQADNSLNDIYKTTSFGVSYVKPMNTTFSMETGLEYTLMKVQTIPGNNTVLPNDTTNSTLSLIEIPIAFRAHFADILFFTSGVLLDFDMNSSAPISKQTGIGLMAGLGLSYELEMGLALYANPFVKLHSLIPFGNWENHQRMLDTGVRFGVMYRL